MINEIHWKDETEDSNTRTTSSNACPFVRGCTVQCVRSSQLFRSIISQLELQNLLETSCHIFSLPVRCGYCCFCGDSIQPSLWIPNRAQCHREHHADLQPQKSNPCHQCQFQGAHEIMGSDTSTWRLQKNGQPQDSVLAPTLFNLCTNDLPATCSERQPWFYATKLVNTVHLSGLRLHTPTFLMYSWTLPCAWFPEPRNQLHCPGYWSLQTLNPSTPA
jgi:hypothetical protein